MKEKRPIEEVYPNGEKITYNGNDYIVCLITNATQVVKAYLYGEASKGDFGIKRFRLPAIQVGQIPNDDYFYHLQVLICTYEKERIKVEDVRSLDSGERQYFYDIEKEEILAAGKGISLNTQTNELIIRKMMVKGPTTNNYYECVLQAKGLWKFLVEDV